MITLFIIKTLAKFEKNASLQKSLLTIASGVYQYSCENDCTGGTSSGITTTCCSLDDCNTVFKISTCFAGTNTAATSTSCTNSGFCKVNSFQKFTFIIKKPL